MASAATRVGQAAPIVRCAYQEEEEVSATLERMPTPTPIETVPASQYEAREPGHHAEEPPQYRAAVDGEALQRRAISLAVVSGGLYAAAAVLASLWLPLVMLATFLGCLAAATLWARARGSSQGIGLEPDGVTIHFGASSLLGGDRVVPYADLDLASARVANLAEETSLAPRLAVGAVTVPGSCVGHYTLRDGSTAYTLLGGRREVLRVDGRPGRPGLLVEIEGAREAAAALASLATQATRANRA